MFILFCYIILFSFCFEHHVKKSRRSLCADRFCENSSGTIISSSYRKFNGEYYSKNKRRKRRRDAACHSSTRTKEPSNSNSGFSFLFFSVLIIPMAFAFFLQTYAATSAIIYYNFILT